jgi:hypothetical protein
MRAVKIFDMWPVMAKTIVPPDAFAVAALINPPAIARRGIVLKTSPRVKMSNDNGATTMGDLVVEVLLPQLVRP